MEGPKKIVNNQKQSKNSSYLTPSFSTIPAAPCTEADSKVNMELSRYASISTALNDSTVGDSRKEEPAASCPHRTGCSRTRRTALRGKISLTLGGMYVSFGRKNPLKVSSPTAGWMQRSSSAQEE